MSTSAFGYNYPERSIRKNEYQTNKALNRFSPGPRYEEVGKEFPTIQENKKHTGVAKPASLSMRTVGVLDYSGRTHNNTANMKSEKENVKPVGGARMNKTYDQHQRQGNIPPGNKNYPPASTSPRRAEAPYGSKNTGANTDRTGGKSQYQLNPVTSPGRAPGQSNAPYGSKNALGGVGRHQNSHPYDQQPRGQGNLTNRETKDEFGPNAEEPLVAPTKEGLSMQSKVDVLSKNKQLIYQETVWTKKRLEKLRATGFGDAAMFKKIRATKEERRWDHIMKFVREDPTQVQKVWMLFRTDYHNLYSVLNEQYLMIIRNYFKPRISNLQTTPANANKMIDILLDQAEQYDHRIYELDQSLAEREKSLSGAMKVLDEARKVVYNWAGREIPESVANDDISTLSQELLDTVVVVSAEKNQELASHIEENAELKKKISKMGKALKDKDRQEKGSKSSIYS